MSKLSPAYRMTKPELMRQAECIAHLYVKTYSPGDGDTRYRFFTNYADDFHSSFGVFTAVGLNQATMFLHGYIEGLRRYRK